MALDVVCGMEVDESTKYKAEHGGKTYYFCSQLCKVNFEISPEKYLQVKWKDE